MKMPGSTRSLLLLGALAPAVLGIGCSTETPSAPRQEPSPPVDLPESTDPGAGASSQQTAPATASGAAEAGSSSPGREGGPEAAGRNG